MLLTTTLEPGVTLRRAPRTLPRPERPEPGLEPGNDQRLRPRERHGDGHPGQPDSRSSSTPARRPSPLLDAGAVSAVHARRDAAAGDVSDPSLLASTPDANTTDPFIQEEAAKLDYDPQQIFNFLHTQIGYNSYIGSVRGAARHALVERRQRPRRRQPGRGPDARLGHPGPVRPGDAVAEPGPAVDPVDVPGQLPDGRLHPGRHADVRPGGRPATAVRDRERTTGSSSTPAAACRTPTRSCPAPRSARPSRRRRARSPRCPTTCGRRPRSSSPPRSTASCGGLFGIGNGLSQHDVLDQTFNDVDLVGRPLTIGNFVSTSSIGGLIFSAVTNTYTPYIHVGDEANPDPAQRRGHRGHGLPGGPDQLPARQPDPDRPVPEHTLSGPEGPNGDLRAHPV